MKVEYTDVRVIKPYPHNPRQNDRTIDKIKQSIERFGWQQPIVVDSDGVIVVGHSRYAAALDLGYDQVPVIWAKELTEKEARAYRIMDNKAHDWTRWDKEELKFE